jgi:hypothetical protein
MNNWCLCEKKGTCIGCLIDVLVKEAYGESGLEFLRRHTWMSRVKPDIKDDKNFILEEEEPKRGWVRE